jgi:hypothetical protein
MRRLVGPLLVAALATELSGQVIRNSQPRLRDQWTFSIGGFGGIPVGDFRKHENGGGGFEVMAGFQPIRRQPIVLRTQMGGLIYGNINRDVEQDYCDVTGCYSETVYYDSRQHSMFYFQSGLELMATDGKIRPFAIALAGITNFSSEAKLGYPSLLGNPPTENLFSASNFSTSYGGGLRWVFGNTGRVGAFQLSAQITRNAKARYMTERGLTRRSDGSWVINPQTGAANVLGIHLGFWLGPNVLWNER